MTPTYLSLITGLLLLGVPAYIVYTCDRRQSAKAAIALGRLLLQTAALGAALWALLHYDRWWLTLAWPALLAAAAAVRMVSRTGLRSGVLLLPAWAAMFVSVLAVSVVTTYGCLGVGTPLAARWLVPVSSVLMAHTLATATPAVRTYFDSLQQDSQTYLTLLGNGATRRAALTPYAAQAMRCLLAPTLANLSVTGLFVVPMLLAGMLLGGMHPLLAAACFVALTLAAVAAAAVAVLLTLWLADRRAFDAHGRLTEVYEHD